MPYSEQHANVAVNFFERMLQHTTGEFDGQPFLLAPWQEEIISTIFGYVDKDGYREIHEAYLEVEKKTGKTTLCAGIALLCLLMDKNRGAEVYSAAAALKQAALVFRVAAAMVERSPYLSSRLRVVRSTYRIVKRDDPTSFYAAIAADGDFSDGVNPSCVIADELHRWSVRKALELWDVLTLGGIARKQPLVVAITTAGVQDESPIAWRYHEKTQQIERGVLNDPRFLGKIYGATEADDWRDEEVWKRVHPGLECNGGFFPISIFRDKLVSTLGNPSAEAAFKRYYLNIWGQKENRWMDMQAWDRCADPTRPLIERVCYAGLDLSSNVDLTSLVLLFPDEDGTFDILPFFWMPIESIRKREFTDRVPYSEWVMAGYIQATEGNVIDIREVKSKIRWAREMFELREVAFDPWNATQLSLELVDEGFSCVPIRQGVASLSEPTKKLMELTLDQKIRHAGNPVLKWNADCVTVKDDGNDNIRPVKPDRMTSSKRIDGIVALIMALNRATLNLQAESNYNYRGLATI